jgi:hypothetical protein
MVWLGEFEKEDTLARKVYQLGFFQIWRREDAYRGQVVDVGHPEVDAL